MNYILRWYDSGFFFDFYEQYYVSHREGARKIQVTATKKIGQAKIFKSEEEAAGLAYELNSTMYMGAIQVKTYTDKELFMKRLEGK